MIYRVRFKEPPLTDDPQTDFYFFSVSAIYRMFTEEQIGCKVTNLWNIRITQGTPYENSKCIITREPVYRTTRNAASVAPESVEDDKSPV